MAVIPDDFTIEGGGRLDPTWFDPYDLIELLGTWIARASTTGASDTLVTARVYAAAFTTAADLLMADPANQRDREKSSAYLAEQLKYWRDQAAAYEDEAAGLIGLNGAVLVQWEGDPPMRVLRRTAPTGRTPAGYAHQGTLVTVTDQQAETLLATGEWHDETPANDPLRTPAKRITEVPAPAPVEEPPTETKTRREKSRGK